MGASHLLTQLTRKHFTAAYCPIAARPIAFAPFAALTRDSG